MRRTWGFRPQRGSGVSDARKRRGHRGEPAPGCPNETRGSENTGAMAGGGEGPRASLLPASG